MLILKEEFSVLCCSGLLVGILIYDNKKIGETKNKTIRHQK